MNPGPQQSRRRGRSPAAASTIGVVDGQFESPVSESFSRQQGGGEGRRVVGQIEINRSSGQLVAAKNAIRRRSHLHER